MININSLPDPIIQVDYKNLYPPSDDTFLLIDFFRGCYDQDFFDGSEINEIENVLDLGTGTGIIAIFLQMIKSQHPLFNPKVYASDIIEDALQCAKNNEILNHFNNNITFFHSDLFQSFPKSLNHSFNIIIFNPPYLPSSELVEQEEKKVPIDHSWNGGTNGYEVFTNFLKDVKEFMHPKGCSIYYISSSRVDLMDLNSIIEKNGFTNIILDKKHVFFEEIILNKLILV